MLTFIEEILDKES